MAKFHGDRSVIQGAVCPLNWRTVFILYLICVSFSSLNMFVFFCLTVAQLTSRPQALPSAAATLMTASSHNHCACLNLAITATTAVRS